MQKSQEKLTCFKEIVVRFGVKRSIFVGDRGMLKGPQLKQMEGQTEHIKALTPVQIRALIKEGVFTIDMFQNKTHTIHHKGLSLYFRQKSYPKERDRRNS